MRDIFFKGKDDEGKWLIGDLAQRFDGSGEVFIWQLMDGFPGPFKVISETVGQYTGINDCKRTKRYPKGQPIFEGDIVRVYDWGYKSKEIIGLCYVVWDVDEIGWRFNGLKNPIEDRYDLKKAFSKCEVIGNIHENSELKES